MRSAMNVEPSSIERLGSALAEGGRVPFEVHNGPPAAIVTYNANGAERLRIFYVDGGLSWEWHTHVVTAFGPPDWGLVRSGAAVTDGVDLAAADVDFEPHVAYVYDLVARILERRGTWTKTVKAHELEVQPLEEGGFGLLHGGRLVTTAMGGDHSVVHPRRRLLDRMRAEFVRRRTLVMDGTRIAEPRFLSAYAFFSLQTDRIEPQTDNLTQDFTSELARDPVLHRPPGPAFAAQLAYYGPVGDWLAEQQLHLVDIDFVSLPHRTVEEDSSTEDFNRLRDWLRLSFLHLAKEERAAVVNLHNLHVGSVVHGVALVEGRCTTEEYAEGVTASHALIPAFADVGERHYARVLRDVRRDAERAIAYIEAYRDT
jgi:hypothetical protein